MGGISESRSDDSQPELGSHSEHGLQGPSGPHRVLVIEDEPGMRDILSDFLEGFIVETAPDGVEGLKKTFETTPDIVLVDIQMPRLTGLEYLRKIRSSIAPGRLPVVIVSGLTGEDQVSEAINCGATDYLTKPFSRKDLLTKVQIALDNRIDPDNLALDTDRFHRERHRLEELPEEGAILDWGKYWILEELGLGGMGVVYRARHMGYGVEVALKILSPKKAREEEFALRFLREVRVAAQLCHPHLVKVLDLGLSGRHYFYAMEFLHSTPLSERRDLLKDDVERKLIGIGCCVGSALEYMHDRGFLHRDVKPDNLLMGPDGLVRLIDFGLTMPIEGKRITKTGTFIGSPGFVAPEIVQRYRPPDVQVDVYALGATLYGLACGVLLGEDATRPQALSDGQISEPLPLLHEVLPQISPRFSDVVGRMVQIDREKRFSSMAEARVALEALR